MNLTLRWGRNPPSRVTQPILTFLLPIHQLPGVDRAAPGRACYSKVRKPTMKSSNRGHGGDSRSYRHQSSRLYLLAGIGFVLQSVESPLTGPKMRQQPSSPSPPALGSFCKASSPPSQGQRCVNNLRPPLRPPWVRFAKSPGPPRRRTKKMRQQPLSPRPALGSFCKIAPPPCRKPVNAQLLPQPTASPASLSLETSVCYSFWWTQQAAQ
jgi:hypothetical protein